MLPQNKSAGKIKCQYDLQAGVAALSTVVTFSPLLLRMRSVTLTSYETSSALAARRQLHLRSRANDHEVMRDGTYRRCLNDGNPKNGIKDAIAESSAQLAEEEAFKLSGSRPCYRLFMMLPAVFIVTLVMAIVQIIGDSDYFERLQGSQSRPLYDLGHQLLPDLNDETKLIAEIPLFAMMALTVAISFAVESKDRTRLLRRFTLLQSTLYMFRTLSLLGTRLPPSDPTCTLRRYEGMSVIIAAIRIVGLLDTACTDMIFSGHTAAATSMLSVWIFHDRVPSCLSFIGALNLAVCGFGFIASRLHYTVDVVVAFIIAALLASLYSTLHQLVNVKYPIVTKSIPAYAKVIHWIEGYDLANVSTHKIQAKRKCLIDLNTSHES